MRKKIYVLFVVFFASVNILSAQITVSGLITDDQGNSIIGATVIEKGTLHGTVSDLDGNYSITVSSADAILVFTYVGMLSVEEAVEGRTTINVQLMPDLIGLEEVVVTALGISRERKTLTYASQQVSGDELRKVSSINFMEAISGKAAGLSIKKSASGAGGSTRVILRGNKSLRGSNEPLYVIDGVPILNIKRGQPGMWGGADGGDGLSQLNPDDIESINVLKGLNASILYGSQGANGVVLITTKKGREGRAVVNVNSSTTFENVLAFPELQFDYGAEGGAKESWSTTRGNYDDGFVNDFFQTGHNLINSFSVSGGTNITTAYFSYANTAARGIVQNNKYDKHNLTFSQSTRLLNDRLTLSSNTMLTAEEINNRNVAGYYLNPLFGLYTFPRERNFQDFRDNYKVFNEDRNMDLQNWHVTDHFQSNPYWLINMQPQQENLRRLIGTATADYIISDNISLVVRGTYDYIDRNTNQKHYAGSNSTNVSTNGRYDFSKTNDSKVYADALLRYDDNFGKFTIMSFVGTSYNMNQWSGIGGNNGTNALHYPNVFSTQNYPTNVMISQSGGKSILQSVYANASVGFDDMVYIDLAGRNDWSSTLAGTGNESYFYPSIGAVALISNMIEMPDFISFVKLRGSQATAAKEVGWNAIRSDHSIAGAFGGINRNTMQPFTDLEPEIITSNELGVELRFFTGRLGMDFTYYYNVSKNQFLNVDLPPEERGQYTWRFINVGEIVNKGVELTLDAMPFRSAGFTWRTMFNFHTNNNEVVELDPDNPERRFHYGSAEGYQTYIVKGGSYGDLYGFMFRRNDAGQIMIDENSGRPLRTATQEYLGNLEPEWSLGWNNNLDIRRFSIGTLVTANIGGKVVSQTEAMLDGYGVSKRSGEARDLGYVEINGIQGTTTVTQIDPFLYYTAIGDRNGILEPYVYDRTNIRLSQLSLSYDLDLTRTNLPINAARISLIGQNLLFLYKKAPFDPELTMNTTQNAQSLDNFNLPSTRTFGFNLTVTL